MRIVNDQTGEELELINNQWVPVKKDTVPWEKRLPENAWRGNAFGGLLQGAWRPIEGAAQFLSHNTPGFIADPLNRFNNWVAETTGLFNPIEGGNLDAMVAQNNAQYEQARAREGRSGFDAAALAGNIISPLNLTVAKALPVNPAASIPALAGKGALYGLIGGATAPVTEGDYTTNKALQMGLGAATGAVITPVIAKVGQAVANRVNGLVSRVGARREASAAETDRIIREALAETQQKITDIPDDYLAALKAQVSDSLSSGKKLDAAALLRQQDFQRMGMQGTAGQITRDPAQYAAERNLRGVAGVGEPLLNRFEQQNRTLQGTFANNADDAYNAGSQMVRRLAKIDQGKSKAISAAYSAARESAGAKSELNLTGLAQDYADVLFRFGDAVPSGIRNQFEQYGLLTGKQTKLMTVDDAELLLKAINDHVGPKGPTKTALDFLRNAVKKSVTDTADDVYGAGRAMAAERFKLLDAVPALKAAAEGTADADSFVQRFVINGKTDQVKGLANILKGTPEYDQARQQIISHFQRAAFGENPAGDALFAPARYTKALRQFGDTKLSQFFTPKEVDLFKTAGRVGAYINSHPASAPVNTSNTGALVANLLRHTLGWTHIGQVASSISQPVKNRIAVDSALKANVPMVSGMSPQEAEFVRQLLGAGSIGTVSSAVQQ